MANRVRETVLTFTNAFGTVTGVEVEWTAQQVVDPDGQKQLLWDTECPVYLEPDPFCYGQSPRLRYVIRQLSGWGGQDIHTANEVTTERQLHGGEYRITRAWEQDKGKGREPIDPAIIDGIQRSIPQDDE